MEFVQWSSYICLYNRTFTFGFHSCLRIFLFHLPCNMSCHAFGRLCRTCWRRYASLCNHVAANDALFHIHTDGHSRGEDNLGSRTLHKVFPYNLLYVGLPWFSPCISASNTSFFSAAFHLQQITHLTSQCQLWGDLRWHMICIGSHHQFSCVALFAKINM